MRPDRCRLCRGPLFKAPLLRLKGMPKAAQYFPVEREFKKDKGIVLNIHQCRLCGLVQLDQKPVSYFKEVITAASFSQKTRLSRLGQIKEFVTLFGLSGKTVLEIGSGTGPTLDILKEAGLVPTGIEASKTSVAAGRALGRRILTGYVEDRKRVSSIFFDAFVSFNYLEHLPNPGAVIQKIYQNTTADAAGFVTVPNLEYLLGSKCLYEFVADHLSYFTQDTLRYAFEKNGFEVTRCRLINDDNDIAVFVRKRRPLEVASSYRDVEGLIGQLRGIVSRYKARNKKIAVWGAGHRTLALLALAGLKDIDHVVDSAKFKQGRSTPILHLGIISPEQLNEKKVGLIIIMVPGLYPEEVLRAVKKMGIKADVAILRANKIEFIKPYSKDIL